MLSKEDHLKKNYNVNPDDDGYDPSEEYFKKKVETDHNETEEYFPQENIKPPHY